MNFLTVVILEKWTELTLKAPVTTIVVCFVICLSRSSLIWVHTVCLYAKIGLKSLQEYSADDINRRHFQMQFFLALQGLSHCRLNELSRYILENPNFDFRYVRLCDLDIPRENKTWLDTTFCSIWSGSALFAITLLGVSRLQWLKVF